MRPSQAATSFTWSFSPSWLAHASAKPSVVTLPPSSKPRETQAVACISFTALRGKKGRAEFPQRCTISPAPSHTTTCTRWRLSIVSPRTRHTSRGRSPWGGKGARSRGRKGFLRSISRILTFPGRGRHSRPLEMFPARKTERNERAQNPAKDSRPPFFPSRVTAPRKKPGSITTASAGWRVPKAWNAPLSPFPRGPRSLHF